MTGTWYEVTVVFDCPECEGRGKRLEEGMAVVCEDCQGAGVIRQAADLLTVLGELGLLEVREAPEKIVVLRKKAEVEARREITPLSYEEIQNYE